MDLFICAKDLFVEAIAASTNEKRSLGRSPVSEAPSHRAMTAAAGMVTRTAAQIILVQSVALGCDVWVTGDEKSVGPRGEMSKSSGPPAWSRRAERGR